MFLFTFIFCTSVQCRRHQKDDVNGMDLLSTILLTNMVRQQQRQAPIAALQYQQPQRKILYKPPECHRRRALVKENLLDQIMTLIDKDEELKLRLRAKLLHHRNSKNSDDYTNSDFAPFPAQPVGFPRYCCKCQKGKRTIQ